MPLNVLVVDDAAEFADLIVMDLKSRSYHASAVYSGLSAIKSALSLKFQAILLDIMMPGEVPLAELSAIPGVQQDKTLLPLTDDLFFRQSSRMPLPHLLKQGANEHAMPDKRFYTIAQLSEMIKPYGDNGPLYVHLDGYLASSIIKSSLADRKQVVVLFFTAGGVNEAFYKRFNGFLADDIFLKSQYYDRVLATLAGLKKGKRPKTGAKSAEKP